MANFIQITPFMHAGILKKRLPSSTIVSGSKRNCVWPIMPICIARQLAFASSKKTAATEQRRLAYYIDVRDVDQL
jgi:hypothetical protein